MAKRTAFTIGDQVVAAGSQGDIRLKISETYTGDPIAMPIRVIHAAKEGPTVFVSAAVHGDELNGTGIIHEVMVRKSMKVRRGTLLLIPVVNVFGFENNQRYLPDRRDLNRSFPGSRSGSLASRIAATFLREVVSQCDYGIDLHTAAVHRNNFPNVRGDLEVPGVELLTRAFGCELILDSKGPAGSLRQAACKKGCPTIILEAGEPFRIDSEVVDVGVRGIRNTLIQLQMLSGRVKTPRYQVHVTNMKWVRARVGGILRFHVEPGDIVEKGQRLATNYSVMAEQQNVLTSPADGIVLSVATTPTVKPGEPVTHIAIPEVPIQEIRRKLQPVRLGPQPSGTALV